MSQVSLLYFGEKILILKVVESNRYLPTSICLFCRGIIIISTRGNNNNKLRSISDNFSSGTLESPLSG